MTATPPIVLVDHGCGIEADLLARVAAALHRQANEHFAPHWLIGAEVRVASAASPPRGDEWQLGLFESPDVADALGYHDQTRDGLPLMKVFPFLDESDGVPWSTTASHELTETLVDPWLRRCAQGPDGKIWAVEVADAVERDQYLIDGIAMSNFVLPAYFEPPPSGAGPFDFMHLVKAPLEIRPGGYGQQWSERHGWLHVPNGEMRPARAMLSRGWGRGVRRHGVGGVGC